MQLYAFSRKPKLTLHIYAFLSGKSFLRLLVTKDKVLSFIQLRVILLFVSILSPLLKAEHDTFSARFLQNGIQKKWPCQGHSKYKEFLVQFCSHLFVPVLNTFCTVFRLYLSPIWTLFEPYLVLKILIPSIQYFWTFFTLTCPSFIPFFTTLKPFFVTFDTSTK